MIFRNSPAFDKPIAQTCGASNNRNMLSGAMNLLRALANRLGYDLFRHARQARIETHLAALLPHLGINVVVDAGANVGQYGRNLRALGYRGRIISYEPLAEVHRALEQAARGDDTWITRPMALGREAGRATIRMSPDTSWSSLRGFSDYGKRRFTEQDRDATTEEIEVVRLDADLPALIADIADPRIYLKMDTQGFDLEVFGGAEGVLAHIQGLQSEVAFQQIYDEVPNYRTALETFEDAGFAVTGLFSVKRDRKTLHMIEMDCVMRRVGDAD